ncbi:DinB family protein [Symbiobacterium thermophilum]|uniref:DinB-like domain-containing protein n=2 Tax=Symbiobacterium thermophilum TaxID=2734 RepID=Q67JY9_SYMTH|nr:DinB family protein [Symbiobacterium thermophilum]MBY6275875.1 DinB family protein [Symbiobacterium thermophilum]OTA41966.1 MAG: hypothetical protein A6D92_02510 [Symbiobacterium thermophilum]BAD42011.1 conserved hypothetical protein [Symbiobacterium thermophilum IAM 14863]
MLTSPADFARYFESVRGRTLAFIQAIPEDRMDFAPQPGKFTFGDLIRHIAATERMFVEGAIEGRWAYPGHGRELGSTKDEALGYLMGAHEEAMARLRAADPGVLQEKRTTPLGATVSAWRLLMMMTEHEIHHRSQIGQYLVALGLEPPQLFGLKLEDFLGR